MTVRYRVGSWLVQITLVDHRQHSGSFDRPVGQRHGQTITRLVRAENPAGHPRNSCRKAGVWASVRACSVLLLVLPPRSPWRCPARLPRPRPRLRTKRSPVRPRRRPSPDVTTRLDQVARGPVAEKFHPRASGLCCARPKRLQHDREHPRWPPCGSVASVVGKIRQAVMMRPRPARVSEPRSSFAGFRFPQDVIMIAVRWYLRYGLMPLWMSSR